MTNVSEHDALLRAKINLETSKIAWKELLRHFAAGMVIVVRDGLDLIEVAARMAADDKDSVAHWLDTGRIAKVSDEEAAAWVDADATLWAVVIKPWILVQMRAS